ncbi:MAG: bifunctional shikimate kinase/3-dehydroquinate synthase [bacterium]
MAPLAAGGADTAPSLVFVGFMGSGKSRALRRAREAGLDGVDTDELLEARAGVSIPELFQREGEDGFRAREQELVLGCLGEGHPAVALGGGAILSAAIRDALREHVVVWMRVPLEELWRRTEGSQRPLARERDEFERLYDERVGLYAAAADAVMLSADAVPEALESLRSLAAARPARMIWAESASGCYPVWVGAGVLARAGSLAGGRSYCITDSNIPKPYIEEIDPETTITVPAGEGAKTMAEVEVVLRELADRGATRSDHIVALGGGVVGDLAGFCAATYQRGIPVIQAPTTLLAQVDSAYGGKTGVDLPGAKNYVGAYHQPAGVVVDVGVLRTLPPQELAAGFVEVVKTGLIAGPTTWDRVKALGALEPEALAPLVFDCALTKLQIVAEDERDRGRRAVLNLGHTVGHAIEAASGYARYRHGEAVGLGLLAALRLSGAEQLRGEVADLLAGHDLPIDLDQEISIDEIIAAIGRDKKRTSAAGLGFVLVERPGVVKYGQTVDAARVRDAVEELR